SQQQTQLLREHFISLGKGIIETALCWWGNENSLHRLITITGIEHLDQAAEKGKGVLLLSAHFTTLEIGGRLLASRHPFQVLYRKHKNPVFEYVMHNARQRRFTKAISRNNTRALISSLSNANAVWYAPDQNDAGANSQFIPFFDILASTTTATSRIAKISRALVIPFFQIRLPENKGYLLTICPPLENFPSEDLHQDTARINRLLERVIKEHPEQYLWAHRRFRTRPDHAPPLY
ncbi:MAG: lipid A biosynthesis lauroyl acyltransferase, partial [Gammaproteobacteria bacterium]